MTLKTIARMASDYCRARIAPTVPPLTTRAIHDYLLQLISSHSLPQREGGGFSWSIIALETGLGVQAVENMARALVPVLSMLCRELPKVPKSERPAKETSRRRSAVSANASVVPGDSKHQAERNSPDAIIADIKCPGMKRGVKPAPIIEFPVPLWDHWDEPSTFQEALALHMRRHGDSYWHLHRAVIRPTEVFDRKTIATWRSGRRIPQTTESMKVLRRIESRYRLPDNYFMAKLPNKSRALTGFDIQGVPRSEQRRLSWHLPHDFNDRPVSEQETILEWVRRVILTGATEYRRFQAAAIKNRYAIRFPGLIEQNFSSPIIAKDEDAEFDSLDSSDLDPDILYSTIDAPAQLRNEMEKLIRFKTSTLTAAGYQRIGVWGTETAAQKIEHLGLLFGALAAVPASAVQGYGVPLRNLTFGLLVFPAVWDWYVQWRERRRGFFTAWEVDMLRLCLALTRQDTGWLRQSAKLFSVIRPVPGLVTASEIDEVQADWDRSCDTLHHHASARVKEVQRVARVHRDPFEPILPILEADSPVGEYRKITEEIVRLMPDERRHPVSAAESVRSFLMLRLGLHLGLRQKNLRQLLVCFRGDTPSTERQLVEAKRGELRWLDKDSVWEVFIPAIAFKNSGSSYFANKPFRLLLPDLAGLYNYIEAYLGRHRAILLRKARDPGTFFIKTVKTTSAGAAYDQTSFYEAWRLTIQRYGIYNPYTNRGAIQGLLPHGPHNIRDVLATHILKKTGSYEQASYAIQDTPDMVAKHYGRFLPQDKAALAAQILNKVWDAV